MTGVQWVAADSVRIFWFIQTYRDLPPLRKTLTTLRQRYPESPVMVVSDGDDDPRIPTVCDAHSAEFSMGGRLFGVEHGGEGVRRMLDLFLARDAEILIKIDPDTDVRSRFTRLPNPSAGALYGTVQSAGVGDERLWSIQGGCIVVPRYAATCLARSGLLQSARLKPPALEWAVGAFARARAAAGLTSYDWTLGWACRELGLGTTDHPEVFSRYRPNLFDSLTRRNAAVAHPRFDASQLARPIFYVPRRWAARFIPY